VASELTLRHTPTLTFEYDPSVDRGMRISELLDSLGQSAAGGDRNDD
jgi:ribosome-binding factor A